MQLSKHLEPACRLLILLMVIYAASLPVASAMAGDAMHDVATLADCGTTADSGPCGDDGTGCGQHCAVAILGLPAAGSSATTLHAHAYTRPGSIAFEERLRPPIG